MAQRRGRLNVLLMIADDHRFDAVHALGDPTVQTPNLDALVEESVTFRRAYVMGAMTGAVCVPSRACLHTGVNVFHGTRPRRPFKSSKVIPPELPLLGSVFREAGYHTHAIGKWHNDKQSFARSFSGATRIFFGGMSDHERVPVQDFDPTGEYAEERQYVGERFSTEMFCDQAIEFLKTYRDEAPFFLYLAFTSPHDPRTAPEPYRSWYDPERIPLPPNFVPAHPFDNGDMDVRDEGLAPMPRTPEAVRRHIADYFTMISHMDAHIGRVLSALDECGLAQETIVVYMSDHGLAVGQHGLLGKQNLYDHSIRIPLILRGPGLPAGRRVDGLVYQYDVFPTLCALTGVPLPDTVEGRSLLELIEGGPWRQSIYAAYKDVQRTVTDGRWKLIRYYRATNQRSGTDRVQLFDLLEDPHECRDRSNDPEVQSHLQRLARELEQWQQAVQDPLAATPVLL